MLKINVSELRKKYLSGERDFEKINLEGANLQGLSLAGINFSNANLKYANLEGCNLQEACLNGANFNRANLSEVDLDRASLIRANLEKANLNDASPHLSLWDIFTKAGHFSLRKIKVLTQVDRKGLLNIDSSNECTSYRNCSY
jgi:uncharacterized protein YjbI with pentapeptide repeats